MTTTPLTGASLSDSTVDTAPSSPLSSFLWNPTHSRDDNKRSFMPTQLRTMHSTVRASSPGPWGYTQAVDRYEYWNKAQLKQLLSARVPGLIIVPTATPGRNGILQLVHAPPVTIRTSMVVTTTISSEWMGQAMSVELISEPVINRIAPGSAGPIPLTIGWRLPGRPSTAANMILAPVRTTSTAAVKQIAFNSVALTATIEPYRFLPMPHPVAKDLKAET
jgi:hypothetical protein